MARGSGRGTCGTLTSPAPSRPRADVLDDEPELRTDTDRPLDLPDSERERRPDTERRDFDDWEAVRELPELPLCAEPLVIPVGGEPTIPVAETTGARPQASQYSSPPPTSS
ncbi:hypothetical protein LK08_05025 [Streptomyces sp. MUSC 125]|nr:hypothetical protein LK08_05025 [Streptomyces sp. MUSC 125]